jgi:undecaprenyl-diphosphatase
MTLFEAVTLGLVQGLTEFIPVSSSGHLILARQFLGFRSFQDLSVDAVLQLATALAVLFYFRKDVWRLIKTFFRWISKRAVSPSDSRLLMAIVAGTIPAAILGLLLESYMETAFRSAVLVAVALLAGSALMIFAERRFKPSSQGISGKKGFFIGFFQSLALIPGMSRSGATISGGLLNGLSRVEAARFSFLLSLPIILGSGLKKLLDLSSTGDLSAIGLPLLLSAVIAFASGFLAIKFLINYLKTRTLNIFIIYRIVLAVLILIFI